MFAAESIQAVAPAVIKHVVQRTHLSAKHASQAVSRRFMHRPAQPPVVRPQHASQAVSRRFMHRPAQPPVVRPQHASQAVSRRFMHRPGHPPVVQPQLASHGTEQKAAKRPTVVHKLKYRIPKHLRAIKMPHEDQEVTYDFLTGTATTNSIRRFGPPVKTFREDNDKREAQRAVSKRLPEHAMHVPQFGVGPLMADPLEADQDISNQSESKTTKPTYSFLCGGPSAWLRAALHLVEFQEAKHTQFDNQNANAQHMLFVIGRAISKTSSSGGQFHGHSTQHYELSVWQLCKKFFEAHGIVEAQEPETWEYDPLQLPKMSWQTLRHIYVPFGAEFVKHKVWNGKRQDLYLVGDINYSAKVYERVEKSLGKPLVYKTGRFYVFVGSDAKEAYHEKLSKWRSIGIPCLPMSVVDIKQQTFLNIVDGRLDGHKIYGFRIPTDGRVSPTIFQDLHRFFLKKGVTVVEGDVKSVTFSEDSASSIVVEDLEGQCLTFPIKEGYMSLGHTNIDGDFQLSSHDISATGVSADYTLELTEQYCMDRYQITKEELPEFVRQAVYLFPPMADGRNWHNSLKACRWNKQNETLQFDIRSTLGANLGSDHATNDVLRNLMLKISSQDGIITQLRLRHCSRKSKPNNMPGIEVLGKNLTVYRGGAGVGNSALGFTFEPKAKPSKD